MGIKWREDFGFVILVVSVLYREEIDLDLLNLSLK